ARFTAAALALGRRRPGAVVVPRVAVRANGARRPSGGVRPRPRSRPFAVTAAHFSSTAEGDLVVHTSHLERRT
ncbi:MAG TPA: hypothetical protein VFO85_15880, partial [Vicinamibacteria bacterium]|nr:hypothetical protein [Vicinamibacteria bacterium]